MHFAKYLIKQNFSDLFWVFTSCTNYKNTASIFPVSCLDVIPFHRR